MQRNAPDRKREKLEKQLEAELAKPTEQIDIWRVLELRKELGWWDGDIDIVPIKEFNLSGGVHYFVVENPATRSIRCTSCPISHGGILEAHMLTRYRVENGVLYFDDRPVNKTPAMDKS